MGISYYNVIMKDNVIAQHMELQDAMIFVEALFQKYYLEPKLAITIVREDISGDLNCLKADIEDEEVSYDCIHS